MNSNHSEPVTFFILQGLDSLGELKKVLFVIFLVAYIIILGGNSMIIFLVRTDPKLGSPMFYFLHNLSFVDIVYTSVTIPNMLSGFLTYNKTISIHGCFLQMYFFIQMAVTGRALLTVMAYDRYVAICDPLRYTTVMTSRIRVCLIFGAWSFGAMCALPSSTPPTVRLYCGPKVIYHCWCDPPSVRSVVCGDTSTDGFVSLFFAIVALAVTGALILTSYILIGVAISKMGSAQQWKAFSTCAAHLTAVTLSFGSASFVYISYRVGNFSPEVRIIVAVLYSALTPFLNPIVYTLRNKELRESIKRVFCRQRAVSPTGRKTLVTLS